MRTIRLFSIHYLVVILFNIYHNVQTLSIRHSPKTSLHICDQFFHINNCYYFSCIDSIFQCGQENLLVQFSYSLCKFEIYSDNFFFLLIINIYQVKQHLNELIIL